MSNYRTANVALSAAFVIVSFAPVLILFMGTILYDFSMSNISNLNKKVIENPKSNFSNIIEFVKKNKIAILGSVLISLFAIRHLYYKRSLQELFGIGDEKSQPLSFFYEGLKNSEEIQPSNDKLVSQVICKFFKDYVTKPGFEYISSIEYKARVVQLLGLLYRVSKSTLITTYDLLECLYDVMSGYDPTDIRSAPML